MSNSDISAFQKVPAHSDLMGLHGFTPGLGQEERRFLSTGVRTDKCSHFFSKYSLHIPCSQTCEAAQTEEGLGNDRSARGQKGSGW